MRVKMTDAKPVMDWIDIETTGLYADIDVPLELGLTLTDKWGAEIDSWKTLVWESTEEYETAYDNMSPFVVNMHKQNGLDNDLKSFKTMTRKQAESSAIDWLVSNSVEAFTLPMSGSSIGSLDRPFCQKHFPNLNAFFHYRNIDISSVRELCKMHNPTLMESIEADIGDRYLEKHRVLEDIQDSITLYRMLYENFFFLED